MAFARMVLAIALGLPTITAVDPVSAAGQTDTSLVTYFIDDGDRLAGFRTSDRELALWALEAWARNANGTIQLQPSREEDAIVRLYWAPAAGSLYGETLPLIVGGRPGAAIFVTTNVEALGPDIASLVHKDALLRETIVYLTCLHELGHAFRLPHTADDRDIMYFFGYGGNVVEYFGRYRRQITARSDIRSVSGLSRADIQRLQSLRAGAR